jgi:DNA helicase Pif1, 2B domain
MHSWLRSDPFTSEIHPLHAWDPTPSWLRFDTFITEIWHIHHWDLTHSSLRSDTFMSEIQHLHEWDPTPSQVRSDTFMSEIWPLHEWDPTLYEWDLTPSWLQSNTFMAEIWPFHQWDPTPSWLRSNTFMTEIQHQSDALMTEIWCVFITEIWHVFTTMTWHVFTTVTWHLHNWDLTYFHNWDLTHFHNWDLMPNSLIYQQFPGEGGVCSSADSIQGTKDDIQYPVEYLNSINMGGFPPSQLQVKRGVPLMLLQNLDPGLNSAMEQGCGWYTWPTGCCMWRSSQDHVQDNRHLFLGMNSPLSCIITNFPCA